jgi:hypothetical protein
MAELAIEFVTSGCRDLSVGLVKQSPAQEFRSRIAQIPRSTYGCVRAVDCLKIKDIKIQAYTRARVLCYLSIDGTCNFMLDIKDI